MGHKSNRIARDAKGRVGDMIRLHCGDCIEAMQTLDDNSINLILTDPPYHKVKNLAWDRQWATAEEYLSWLGNVLAEFHRVLKSNGSLYMFASPQMAARVECKIAETFNVLNRIVWAKPPYSTKAEMFRKGDLRMFFPATEYIFFAEHGSNGCCEPIRAYLDGEKERAGMTTRQVAEAFQGKTGSRTVTGMARHWFTQVQWTLPTKENYLWLRELFGGDYLRREYEDLRRPFAVTAAVPYTDVWTFKTVQAYSGKHPCQKPQAMIEHIIKASSREGDTILDAFSGSGVVAVAARDLSRNAICIDASQHWIDHTRERLAQPMLRGI